MPRILVLNPNTSSTTTAMMVRLVQARCPLDWSVHGATATVGVAMIAAPHELTHAAVQVPQIWTQAQQQALDQGYAWDGVILACFADPALDWLRDTTGVPTIGIGEAAMRAASQGERRFGIATTTPQLDVAMRTMACQYGLGHLYTGARYTQGNPLQLLATPRQLHTQLLHAVAQCRQLDRAKVAVIGGGPLGQAAELLNPSAPLPLVAPLTAAAQWMLNTLLSTTAKKPTP